MTREQLDAIRARVEAATPGPWEPSSDTLTWIHVEAHGLTVAECRTYLNRQHTDKQNDANAAFIASAREDVPALLAEVERLTAERDAIAKTAVQEWKDASGYDDLLAAYSSAGHERDLAQNRLEAWKSCLHCGNTRADGDFWEDHCPACKHEDRKVNDAFQRGVAAMREAAVQSFRPDPFDYIAPRIRALPDPEDKR